MTGRTDALEAARNAAHQDSDTTMSGPENRSIDAITLSTRDSFDVRAGRSPVFFPVVAPELKSFDLESINMFFKSYRKYSTLITERRDVHLEDIHAQSIKSCVDLECLKGLAKYRLKKAIVDITDDDITTYLKSIQKQSGSLSSATNLEQLIKEKIIMDVTITSIEQRVNDYFTRFDTFIEDHGLEHIYSGPKKAIKKKIEVLRMGLRPKDLKTLVERAIKFGDQQEAEKDEAVFFELVDSVAKEQHKFSTLQTDVDKKARSSFSKPHQQQQQGGLKKSQPVAPSKTDGKFKADDKSQISEQVRQRFESKPPPPSGCLLCKGKHWVQICPTSTPEQRKEAFDRFKAERAKQDRATFQNKRFSASSCANVVFPPPEPNQVLIHNTISFNFELDNGSSHTTIGMNMLERIQAVTHVPFRLFNPPLCSKLATNDYTATIIGSAILDLTLTRATGTVTLRRREVFVTKEPMTDDVVLIGKPELHSLGVDPDLLLDQILDGVPTRHMEIDLDDCADPLPVACNQTFRNKRNTVSMESMFTGQVDPGDDYTINLGDHSEPEVERAIDNLIDRAVEKGLPVAHKSRLSQIVFKYKDIWRVRLGRDPPAKVTPMHLKFKPDSKPVRCKARRYPELHQDFLHEHTSSLEQNGLIYRNPHSRYASACLVIEKKNVERRGYRLTVDVKDVNAQIDRSIWPMPHLDIILGYLRNAQIFILLDAFKGYWQFPLHADSQEACSFMTHEAVFTPRRIIQGICDAVFAFQSGMQEVLDDLLYKCALLWIDDILGYVSSFSDYFDVLEKLFKHLSKFNVKCNPDRCDLFLHTVQWCGRVISSEGVTFDPNFIAAVKNMSIPNNAAELQQFLCALNWMRSSIPRFAEMVHPLQDLLLSASREAKSLKKTILKRVPLGKIGWNESHSSCFQSIKTTLCELMTLSHPMDGWLRFLFPDASDQFWSIFLTQIPPDDISKPYEDQRHEPLAFISGQFKDSQIHWPIIEKEGFPLIEGCHRLKHYLLSRFPFIIFTDHRNLVYIMDPLSRSTSTSRTSGDRLERWKLQIMDLNYRIEHISGEDNVWADLGTRWGVPIGPSVKAAVCAKRPLQSLAMNSHRIHFEEYKIADDFIWPTEPAIIEAQSIFLSDTNTVAVNGAIELADGVTLSLTDNAWRTKANQLWIPSLPLQIRIMVISHMGLSGHVVVETAISQVQQFFWWPDFKTQIRRFIDKCLHCLRVKDSMIPRPFGYAMHATKSNKIIHYDFLFIGKTRTDYDHKFQYVLVIKDDLSNFVELIACEAADHFTVVEGLMNWFKRFGIVYQHVSDQGSHFKNQVVQELCARLHIQQHFVTAYTPWANGTVEVVNRQILFILKSLLSEFGLSFPDWPTLLPLVNMVINQKVRSRIGFAPVTIFTGLEPTTLMTSIFVPRLDQVMEIPMTPDRLNTVTSALLDNLDIFHKQSADRVSTQRQQQHKSRLRRKMVKQINFALGDYVLVATNIKHRRRKSEYNWTGPAQIVEIINEHIYAVRDLITNESSEIHAQRLKFYDDSSLAMTAELYNNISLTGATFIVDKIADIRTDQDSGLPELLIYWKGFEFSDSTWEPFASIAADIPAEVKKFLKSRPADVLSLSLLNSL